MGLTVHSYGCNNEKLSNEEKQGLSILFKKYIYINDKKDTDWLDKETLQFIDSKNSVFHRAKDEIRKERKERKEGGRKKRTRKKKRKYKKRKSRRKKGSGGVCSRPIRVTPINTSLNVVPGVVVHEVTANAPTASELRMAVPYDDGERDVGMIRLRQGLNNNNSTRPINPLRQVLEYQIENNRRNQEQRRLQQLQERINRAWEGGKRKKKRKKKTKKRKRRRKKRKTRRR